MKKERIISKLLAIICLITLVIPSFSEVIAATSDIIGNSQETAKFGISLLNQNGWGYKIQNRLTYRIYEINGQNKNYNRDIYCLDYTKKFPGEDSNENTFTTTGDMTDSIANKEKIKLIASNMYLNNMTQTEKDETLSKIFADLINRTSTDANPVTLEYIKETISEDDIFFAQQCAIWKYTNNLEWQGSAIWLTNKENPSDSDWYQISNVGEARFSFMQEIYNYLTSDKLADNNNLTNPSLIKSEKTSTEVEDGYIVGPFHIQTGTNTNYTVTLTDQSGANLTYTVVDKDGNTIGNNVSNVLNRDFYIKLPLKTTTTKVILTLNYNSYTTTTKMWTNSKNDTQPLLEITREKNPGSDKDEATIERPEKVYDLALRKYIVKVGDTEITDRKPTITYNKNNQEFTYKHKKDPVVLKAGDTVVYTITIYNEGNQNGRATRVIDYLPEGLEFVRDSEINKKYGWIRSQDGTYIVTAYPKDFELAAFDQSTNKISIVSLQVECRVKENVTSGILTNVAEITDDNIDDIDSTPGSIDITNIDLPNYTGRDSNKDDLTDSDYFYRGQEDDDDFEKVTVEQPKVELDLALRKYISTINGVNQSREPQVDVTPLIDGTGTTAIYTHSKEPLEVKTGDVVIYSIRIYNEADVDTYANEITDYLPEGLGFLVNHEINYNNGWRITAPETPETVKLNTIENATQNLSTSDFINITSLNDVDVIKGELTIKSNKLQYTDGGNQNVIEAFDSSKTEPSSKVLQVACVVLGDEIEEGIIKNIAAVTDERDENGNEATDRDSQPEELNPDEYPENNNIQDDDDFEKLILENKKYDLALKKFLSSVDGKEISPSRLQNVDTTPLQNGENDAIYTMDKSVVKVSNRDNVIYTIRVYNEGEVDAYAQEIRDNIPEGLEFIENSEINSEYRWRLEGNQVVTDYLSEEVNPDRQIPAFNQETGTISFQEVKIEFRVVTDEIKQITNIAEITEDDGDDIDSTPDNDNPDEDDQDYDNIIPTIYDLALKKFLSSVEGEEISPSRLQSVDTTPLQNGENDAEYTMDKSIVKVANGNNVIYTIRVYNEGEVDAYVQEIRDNIPEGLEFVEDSEINSEYRWRLEGDQVVTDYLSEEVNPDRQIPAFNQETGTISYQEVRIEFTVVSDELKVIKNIAEITEDDGDDIDSTPDNDNPDEDDQDYDNIIPVVYDLALQKFITKVNDEEITSRIPMLTISEDNEITYNHTDEPLTVVNQSIIIYTIRVYNEGTEAAYVEEIKDDIPQGLIYLPDHEINQQYGWKLYDENGNEVENVEQATYIRTTYLSKAESEARGEDNQLKPFDKALGITDENPDYRDVQVAFQVDQTQLEGLTGTIRNIAEITEDDGDDVDSTPDNDNPDEDDIDDEEIQLKYFDLSLLKYITKVVVNEDGIVKEIETGHDGTENPEPAVKVEINRKKLDKTSVTFIYTIKVTNEGEIEGYATEIKDRIPEGLEFYQEDNPHWTISEDGIVTTNALADVLLQPGESATVEIALRWKKDENNLGMKVNVAEISEDDNPYDVPDIDSTPDNNEDGEDDQDDAPVVLSVSTGIGTTHTILIITITTIMSTGVYAIKKFVL